MQRVINAVLALLDLHFRGAANADHRDAAGELGQPLLQLLAIVVGGGLLNLRLGLRDAALDLYDPSSAGIAAHNHAGRASSSHARVDTGLNLSKARSLAMRRKLAAVRQQHSRTLSQLSFGSSSRSRLPRGSKRTGILPALEQCKWRTVELATGCRFVTERQSGASASVPSRAKGAPGGLAGGDVTRPPLRGHHPCQSISSRPVDLRTAAGWRQFSSTRWLGSASDTASLSGWAGKASQHQTGTGLSRRDAASLHLGRLEMRVN